MATVKDTETFIAAARAVHGDRYDYSQTVYAGSQSPITIVCRVCGPFVLAEAGTHYRTTKKACGCRTCEKKGSLRRQGRIRFCPGCRNWARYKDAKGFCRDCQPAARLRKQDRAKLLLQRQCKTCGKVMGSKDPRQVVCSRECGHKGRALERISVACSVCGKVVVRTETEIARRERFACGLECQKVVAGRAGKDWAASSRKARAKWKRESRNRRRLLRYGDFIAELPARMAKVRPSPPQCPWRVAVTTRIASGRHRRPVRFVEIRPSGSVLAAIRKLDHERYRFELPDWYKKVAGKLGGMSKRRRRKRVASQQSNVESGSSTGDDRAVWAQVCFDWMGDNSAVLRN